jgi:chromosome segregation ATPase
VLQLEEELADSKATAVRHESSLEASANKVKSLEKQLAEARDSLAEGSKTKAEEADKARQKLEDAMARCTQVSEVPFQS